MGDDCLLLPLCSADGDDGARFFVLASSSSLLVEAFDDAVVALFDVFLGCCVRFFFTCGLSTFFGSTMGGRGAAPIQPLVEVPFISVSLLLASDSLSMGKREWMRFESSGASHDEVREEVAERMLILLCWLLANVMRAWQLVSPLTSPPLGFLVVVDMRFRHWVTASDFTGSSSDQCQTNARN